MRPRRKVRATVPKKKQVRRARRKAAAPTGGTRNPFTGLLVTGIRSLVAALPLSTFLTPITDLILSSIGIAPKNSPVETNGITAFDGVSIYGMCGMVMIKYTNILIRSSMAAVNTTKGSRSWVDTPYTDAKLVSITITITPDNKVQNRSGRWGIVFLPFREKNDEKTIQNDYRPLTLSQLQQMAGSVSGPADKTLRLTFSPRPEDGLIYQYNPMDTWFGAIVIAFSENIRLNYHEFTADDFAPDITVRGSLKLRQPHFGSPTVGYQDNTWSPNYPMMVYGETNKKIYSYKDTAQYSCKHSESSPGQCKVTGHLAPDKIELDLESMALE
jgi:hypothetical protein